RPAEPQGRRHRAGPPHRHDRRADRADGGLRAPRARPQPRARHAVHLGRHGHGRGPGASLMVHALVLVQCEIDEIPEAAQAIADIDGVTEVYSVAGEFDLVAIVRVAAHDDLAKVIPGGIAKVEGVVRTESLIAFQVYSRHDLERMFSIGFDGT